MAIEDPPPVAVAVKSLSGNVSWANFQENIESGWNSDIAGNYHHQNVDWTVQGACGSEWQDFSQTSESLTETNREWYNFSHTESKTEWQDFSDTEANTKWQDFNHAESKTEWQDFSQIDSRTETSCSVKNRFKPTPRDTYASRSCEVFCQCFPLTYTHSERFSVSFRPLNACR